jgi:hypothetical protein
MTQKRSLADLAAAFTAKTGGSDNASWKLFFNFWKAPVDSVSTVRFLPDQDEENPMGFLVENLTHELTINGKREKVACLKMYGEACPICELSARFYDKNSPEFNEELGKQFYRKKSYIGQVLVIDSPVDHDAAQLVKLIDFGPQVFKQIQAAFQSGDLDAAPFELKGGYNFRFRKTVTGSGQNSYTTSSFAPKQSDVEDAVLEAITLFNLSDYRTAKTERAALEAMLAAAQTGGTYEEKAPASAPAPAAKPVPAAAAPAPAAEAAPAPAPAAEVPAATGAKLSVVEQLRARAAAAKAAAAATA